MNNKKKISISFYQKFVYLIKNLFMYFIYGLIYRNIFKKQLGALYMLDFIQMF